jgi:hypothetical protein
MGFMETPHAIEMTQGAGKALQDIPEVSLSGLSLIPGGGFAEVGALFTIGDSSTGIRESM